MNKPTTLIDSLRRQCENPSQIYRQGSDVEQRLKKCKNGDASVKAIAEILAVGLLTATAAVATMGETKAFKSGCDSADFIGARSNKAVIELHPTRSLKYKKPTQTGGVYIDIMEDKFVALYPRAILRW